MSGCLGLRGVIFGCLGHLLLTGWFERCLRAVALSIVAFLVWAPMVIGVPPIRSEVSWESHLFGCLAGTLAA